MDYRRDVEVLRNGPITDDNLMFATSAPTGAELASA